MTNQNKTKRQISLEIIIKKLKLELKTTNRKNQKAFKSIRKELKLESKILIDKVKKSLNQQEIKDLKTQ